MERLLVPVSLHYSGLVDGGYIDRQAIANG